jgi:peptidoglycan/LPS O-acetylase OafA/YrhL
LSIPFIPDGASYPAIRLAVQPVLAALLLSEIRNHQDTPLVRLLETRGFVYLGHISYGFYLVHQFISADFLSEMTAGVVNITAWTPVAQFLPLLLASICVASCSWRWLEQPIILAAKGVSSKPKDAKYYSSVPRLAIFKAGK